MFFPSSPTTPQLGDTVCFRHCHDPYTVGMVSPDRTLYHLVGLDEPARIETLAWYPTVGDRVEILFAPYLKYLQERFNHHQLRWFDTPSERPAIDRTLAAIKAAMKKGINYRTGELMRVEGALAQVRFGKESLEVVPFECLSVTAREREDATISIDRAA